MLRYWITIAVAVAAFSPQALRAQSQEEMEAFSGAAVAAPRGGVDDMPMVPEFPFGQSNYPRSLDDFAIDSGLAHDALCPPTDYLPALGWLGLRHGHTHGRHVGRGGPLVGSSWLNRPYYVGGEFGSLWINRSIHEDVSRDTDAFGGIFVGWDRDPYWGAELRFDWATPELINYAAPDARRTDSLFMWSYSLLYYPWGDATWRPYWRVGIGDTRFDFPLADGTRHDQWMLTVPIGIGVKYPVRRWLAARAEITDHLGVGHSRANAQNNLALTVGLEWHFGAHPRSYWPWQPSRHIW